MNLEIKHDKKNQRFYAEKNHKESELLYKKIDEQTLDYYSTYVPESLREQGIAGQVTEYALQYAKDNHYQVVPSCPYVKSYIDKHPKYQSLLK